MDFTNPPKIGACINGHKSDVTSLSFHSSGAHLFAASGGDSLLRLIDCQAGEEKLVIRCENDGVRLVEATHHDYSVLFTGENGSSETPKKRHAINYLSTYDNKILRTFEGHCGTVTNISMCPIDDCFLTSGEDRTMRLWNLSQVVPLGKMDLPSNAVGSLHASFDSTGLVFGVTAAMNGGSGHMIHLYDARKYTGGAFAELKVPIHSIEKAMHLKGISSDLASSLSKAQWKSMSFDASGKHLLISCEKGLGLLLDGFEGGVNHIFISEGPTPDTPPQHPLNVCFSPDGATVLGGCEDGVVRCWDTISGKLVGTLDGGHGGKRVSCLKANPRLKVVASSCKNTALWIWP